MGKVENKIDREKRRMANWLQQQSSKASIRMQKMVLVLAFFLVALYCLTLIVGSGENKIKIQSVAKLKTVGNNSEADMLESRVSGLQSYLDSLSTSESGSLKRDSILMKNPGILDSIEVWKKQIEKIKN